MSRRTPASSSAGAERGIPRHHEDERLDEAACVLRADRARVQHVGVPARHRLERARHHPLARRP